MLFQWINFVEFFQIEQITERKRKKKKKEESTVLFVLISYLISYHQLNISSFRNFVKLFFDRLINKRKNWEKIEKKLRRNWAERKWRLFLNELLSFHSNFKCFFRMDNYLALVTKDENFFAQNHIFWVKSRIKVKIVLWSVDGLWHNWLERIK